MIRTQDLTMRFGGITALAGVSLDVDSGELFSIIGPNGSGKSTLFNVITGIYNPVQGDVFLEGRRVTAQSPAYLNHQGIGRTFQNIQLFSSMTVLENVEVASSIRSTAPLWRELIGMRSARQTHDIVAAEARQALAAVGLADKADLPAVSLPFGDQKRLEIARALATQPKILLLDEPVAGLEASERREMAELIRSMQTKGLTILLIEHDMRVVMDISDRIMVLHNGRTIAQGSPDVVQKDPEVIAAYLGVEEEQLAVEESGYAGS